MRKSLVLAVILTALSLVFGLGACLEIQEGKDQVQIGQTVLEGDPAAAEGLSLKNRVTVGYHLFWDISCRFGEAFQTESKFSFTPRQSYEGETGSVYVGLDPGFNFSISSVLDLEEDNDGYFAFPLPIEMIRDVAGSTPAGGTHSQALYVRDYYEYYPLNIDLYLPGIDSYRLEDKQREVTDYFRIPVSPEHIVWMTVTKDQWGNVAEVSCNEGVGGVQIWAEGALLEDACYISVNVMKVEEGETVPSEHLAQFSGIHRIPLVREEDGIFRVDVAHMQPVYDAKGAQVLCMAPSFDKTRLLTAFRQEEGKVYFCELEPDTGELLQKEELTGFSGEDSGVWFKIYENFVIAVSWEGRFWLFEKLPQGGYERKMTGDFNQCPQALESMNDNLSIVSMAFDGKRLAVASGGREQTDERIVDGVNFYLTVYDARGLLYAGRYENSLSRGEDRLQDRCMMVEKEPLLLSF